MRTQATVDLHHTKLTGMSVGEKGVTKDEEMDFLQKYLAVYSGIRSKDIQVLNFSLVVVLIHKEETKQQTPPPPTPPPHGRSG